jgi:hypothetical protein
MNSKRDRQYLFGPRPFHSSRRKTNEIPQGPRRPRLSFFLFNCQTAKPRSQSRGKFLRRPILKPRRAKAQPNQKIIALKQSSPTPNATSLKAAFETRPFARPPASTSSPTKTNQSPPRLSAGRIHSRDRPVKQMPENQMARQPPKRRRRRCAHIRPTTNHVKQKVMKFYAEARGENSARFRMNIFMP